MTYDVTPIKFRSEDTLGFKVFAESIAKRILNYDSKESFAIGLYGEWGFGKTSIINMIYDYINSEIKKDQPIIIFFNPWNFSDQNTLLLHYFDLLKTKLKKNKSKKIKKAGEYIEKYSKVLSLSKYIPTIGPIGELLTEFGTKFGLSLQGLKVNKDIEELRKEINKLLIESNKKLLLIIDDIDRLNNHEIKQIFQLVKKLSDFHNTIFMLSFSKDIILNALNNIQIGDGFMYLEKIIQYQYDVPLIPSNKIESLLNTGINNILKTYNIKNWDKYYWNKIYYKGLKNNFKNLRHVKRFLNAFEFAPQIIGNEVNCVDQAAMTAIQVFYPKLFSIIKDNEEKFTGIITENIFETKYFNENIVPLKDEYEKLINSVYKNEDIKINIINILRILFPKIDTIYDGKNYIADEYKEFVENFRICIPEIFETYFRLTVPEYELSMKEFDELIENTYNINELTKKIEDIEKKGKTSSFIEKIINNIKNVSDEKAEAFVCVLMDLADEMRSPVKKYLNDFSSLHDLIYMAIYNLVLIFKKLEKRFDVLKLAIEKSKSIYMPIYFLSVQDNEHKNKEDNNKLIDDNSIGILKNILISKINDFAKTNILINHFRLPFILYRWEKWSSNKEVEDYVNGIIQNDNNLVTFISRFLFKTTSFSNDNILSGESFDIYYKDIIHFINVKEVGPRISKIYFDKFSNLEDSVEKIGLNLFLEYYEGKKHSRS